ncbi:phage shock protein C (PspC) family protein [Micromonospora matsumotoense]|uniref:Phage shock protein C (PspC) family protein n=1 Tax=Micromonospora matsumotoense TaxID=121616 RepID=A0A1C4WDN5_9ACTN|nr:PspC domain-containing protein [Micromonospora matsumotoense]SCE94312.1 phage shock protein C (PspC) family protein [Micromonospora matsumotoense]
MTSTSTPHAPYKQLRRPTTDRMVAGVASGLGRYFAVDPTLVRVLFAVATLVTGGLAALAYPIMWFLMPEEPAGAPAWPHPTGPATPPQSPGWPHPTGPAARPQPPAWPHPTEPATPPQPGVPVAQPRPEPQPPTAG